MLQPKTQQAPILKLLKPTREAKKVSVDDGFTAIPNELLEAILIADLTNAERKYVLAVIRKTLSWHKEMDWICSEQIEELTKIGGKAEISRTKKSLLRKNVLVQEGKKIGVNLVVSGWKNDGLCKNATKQKVVQKRNKNCVKTQSALCKNATTKETITKYKINTPLPPNGESAITEQQAGENRFAEQSQNQTACQTETSKPITPKAKSKPKEPSLPAEDVMAIYNELNEEHGNPLPEAIALNDKRKRAVKKFLGELKRPDAECVGNYFARFFSLLRDFHKGLQAGSSWRATFDYAIRAETVLKVREGTL